MGKRRAVVTGIGVVSPLGNSCPALYEALKAGRSGIRAMTEWSDKFGKAIAGAPASVADAEAKRINRKVRRTMGAAALFSGVAALEAVEQLRAEGNEWLSETHIWLYRGAWMEWELGRVDMAVPLSPDEVVKKRHAIFRHLSQKDIVPFPGEDPREFWQRAEERTQNTAKLYDQLGMAEYQAIEVFLKLC